MASSTAEASAVRSFERAQAREGAARPLRVVQVLRNLDTGGQEMLCARLVERLDPQGFTSLVVSLGGDGWLGDRLRERGIPVRCLNAPDGTQPGAVLRLAGLLRQERADIVHCHNFKAFLYGGAASLLAPGTRLVLTKHGATFWGDRKTATVGVRLLRRAAAVIAVSDDIARLMREGGMVRDRQLRTVLNGIDTDEFRPSVDRDAIRASLGYAPERRVVGTAARLSPEKDQATLLRAFALLVERMPEARLLVVGDGRLRGELESLAAELGISGRTVFTGERQDVSRLLRAMDVFTLPSLTEGTSLTLLEAMSTGLPVVATAVGGTPEVVRDGESGLLVPPGQPARLAEALEQVLRDPVSAGRMGTAGRETVCARYSLAAMVEQYSRVYEGLVAQRT